LPFGSLFFGMLLVSWLLFSGFLLGLRAFPLVSDGFVGPHHAEAREEGCVAGEHTHDDQDARHQERRAEVGYGAAEERQGQQPGHDVAAAVERRHFQSARRDGEIGIACDVGRCRG
jgi:hypothetical protein